MNENVLDIDFKFKFGTLASYEHGIYNLDGCVKRKVFDIINAYIFDNCVLFSYKNQYVHIGVFDSSYNVCFTAETLNTCCIDLFKAINAEYNYNKCSSIIAFILLVWPEIRDYADTDHRTKLFQWMVGCLLDIRIESEWGARFVASTSHYTEWKQLPETSMGLNRYGASAYTIKVYQTSRLPYPESYFTLMFYSEEARRLYTQAVGEGDKIVWQYVILLFTITVLGGEYDLKVPLKDIIDVFIGVMPGEYKEFFRIPSILA